MIRDDVPLYVEEIKRQLWSGQASLLVGSGFSKNAELCSSDTPIPPTWDELKKEMVNILYKEYDENKRREIYNKKDVMEIASEYAALFRRSGLVAFLEEQIQDQNLLPSVLHKTLLELPWKDVFTTNYDTLLEKTAQELFSRKYNLITSFQQLPLVDSPRLIKLHGTIHSKDMPMIITADDYRTYSHQFALFARTFQQAIVSTNLCLIGFSGKDPNFQNWSGYVRDILQNDCPQIYLIDKWEEDLPQAEQMRYEQQHIKPVNLAYWGADKDYKELLSLFLCALFDNQENGFLTEVNIKYISPSIEAIKNKENRMKEFSSILEEWKKQRERNDGWFVLPYSECKKILMYTERWSMIPQFCTELPLGADIRGLFEYNWRIEHCLMPILNDNIQYYETIVKRHNPFKIKDEAFFSQNAFVSEDNDPEKDSLRRIWIELMLAILRWKRENLFIEDFIKYRRILEEAIQPFSEYDKRLLYERALFAMSCPDFEELTRVLAQWRDSPSSPEWNIKYASIIAELGNYNETWDLLKQTLVEIRKHTINDDRNSLYFMGLEGIALTGIRLCKRGKAFIQRLEDSTISGASDTAEGSSVLQNNLINDTIVGERLKALNSRDCDPICDMERFQLSLLNQPKEQSQLKKTTRIFDNTVVTFSFGNGWGDDAVTGYQFIRYLEETGILQHLDFVGFVDNQLVNAIRRIAQYSCWLAFAAFNRIGTKDNADYELFLSQSVIQRFTNTQANEITSRFIREVRWLIENTRDKLAALFNNFYKKTFATLLESISRLIVKTAPEVQQSLLDLLIVIFSCPVNRFGVETQIRNCIKRLFDTMSTDLICVNLEKILRLDLPRESNAAFWQNPFDHITLHKSDLTKIKDRNAITSCLDTWLDYLYSGTDWQRRNALNVLIVFYDFGIMNEIQIQRFTKGLFSKLNQYGFPISTDYRIWVFLKLAKHLEIPQTVSNNLLKFYSGYGFNISDSNQQSYSFFDTCYSILVNMSFSEGKANAHLYASEQDIQEIFNHIQSSVFQFIDQRANTPKSLPNPFFNDPSSSRLLQLDRIIAEIIIPRTKDETKRSQIIAFIQRAEKSQAFPSSRCALLQKEDHFPDDLIQEFFVAISSSDQELFNLYSWAILNAYIRAENNTGPLVPTKFFHSFLVILGMKTEETFKLACGTLTAILDHYTMNRQEKELMLCRLEQMEIETRFSNESSRFPYESRYDYRIAAGGLAARVYKTFVDKNETEIPKSLLRWKSICNSPDEFPSLRNKWDEVVNNDK